jgi:hypothetical protein
MITSTNRIADLADFTLSDAVRELFSSDGPHAVIDARAEAERLLERFPGSGLSVDQIALMIARESAAYPDRGVMLRGEG